MRNQRGNFCFLEKNVSTGRKGGKEKREVGRAAGRGKQGGGGTNGGPAPELRPHRAPRGGGGAEGEGGAGRGGTSGGPAPSSDLVVLRQDHEHQLEVGALAEGHASLLLLAAPLAAQMRVEHHLVPAIKAGIEVEGNVGARVRPRHEVHAEPGQETGRAVPLQDPTCPTEDPPPGSPL